MSSSTRSVKSLSPAKTGKSDMGSDLGCNLGLGSWSLAIWVVIIIVPLIIWFILITSQPSWVKDDNGNGGTVNNQKVFIWTVVITIIVWIILWILWQSMGSSYWA